MAERTAAPRWPYRLPRSGGGDRVMRVRDGICERLLRVDGAPVRVRAWHSSRSEVRFRAEAIDPERLSIPGGGEPPAPAGSDQLELAIERMRFALGVDDDMGPFFRAFRGDPLIGPVIHRVPWLRPRRRPWPWEALAWAITEQLIESSRAAVIQRRIVGRWGPRLELGEGGPGGRRPGARRTGASPRRSARRGGARELRDVPGPELIAGRAPAELVSMDLTEARALAMRRCARDAAAGRLDLFARDSDRRLLAIREVGPWTVQCLGLRGRGDADSLPAGDLAYIKLVGALAGLGRRATVAEVEEFFAPYAPFRGLAGTFALVGHSRSSAASLPHRLAA